MSGERERVIAEGESDLEPWLVMFPDGEVREYANRKGALAAIRRRAARIVPDGRLLVTEIEWRYRR